MEEEKSLAIVAPEGYEIDKEKSTLERIIFKKKEEKIKSYEDIAKKLFSNTPFYYINSLGDIKISDRSKDNWCDLNNAPTKEQLEWLMALNLLRNTALVLNDGWEPDWNDCDMAKFGFAYQHSTNEIRPYLYRDFQVSTVYFKTESLALKAVKLLSEETIKTALGVYLVD